MLAAGCDAPATRAATAPREAAPSAPAFPVLTGRVVDQAELIPVPAEAALVERLAAVEADTRHQFVVVTVASLGEAAVEDYARDLGNHWGIGRKGVNDGVVMLVAPNERVMRIAVGYGLEQALTDEEAAQIIDEAMLPAFREGRFSDGIAAGAERVIAQISEPVQ